MILISIVKPVKVLSCRLCKTKSVGSVTHHKSGVRKCAETFVLGVNSYPNNMHRNCVCTRLYMFTTILCGD